MNKQDTSSSCPSPQNVFVIGANGQTGYRVVRSLQQYDNYQPIAMVRHASQSARLDDLQVPVVVGDIEAGFPTRQQLQGCHVVVFCAGAGRERPNIKKVSIDYLEAVQSMVAAQETPSVTRNVLVSGINTDPQGTRGSFHAPDLNGPLAAWHRLKAHAETYLKESHLYGRPLDWTILCPGRLLDDATGKPGTRLIKASLMHGEDDLKASLTESGKQAAVKSFPGSHDGKMERLCISRDNTAAALLGL